MSANTKELDRMYTIFMGAIAIIIVACLFLAPEFIGGLVFGAFMLTVIWAIASYAANANTVND